MGGPWDRTCSRRYYNCALPAPLPSPAPEGRPPADAPRRGRGHPPPRGGRPPDIGVGGVQGGGQGQGSWGVGGRGTSGRGNRLGDRSMGWGRGRGRPHLSAGTRRRPAGGGGRRGRAPRTPPPAMIPGGAGPAPGRPRACPPTLRRGRAWGSAPPGAPVGVRPGVGPRARGCPGACGGRPAPARSPSRSPSPVLAGVGCGDERLRLRVSRSSRARWEALRAQPMATHAPVQRTVDTAATDQT